MENPQFLGWDGSSVFNGSIQVRKKEQMDTLKSFSVKYPILFVIILIVLWWILMMLVSGIAAGVLHVSYDNAASAILGRIFVIMCGILLIWKFGWLKYARITCLATRLIWLITLSGLIYYTCTSLYAFFGEVSFDIPIMTRLQTISSIAMTQFLVALNEEILFRGIVLCTLINKWGKTTCGRIVSVFLTSLLFAILHATQILTDNLNPSAAGYLVLGTFFLSTWWGALALSSGSIWPSVLFHFVGNSVVIVQGFSTPLLEHGSVLYDALCGLVWFWA